MSTGWIIAIIDIVFVLFLGIGFWAGAARGVKRSALDLGIMIAGVIIVGFITPPITNALLKITVSFNGTSASLETFFIQAFAGEGSSMESLLNSAPTVALFLRKLPSILLCSIVFLVLNLVMRLVAYLIYKIIAVCAFKTKKKEKAKGLKRNWWAGGLIGTVKMFLLVLVIFMPLTSLVKLADKIVPEPAVVAATSQTEEDPLSKALSSLPKEVKMATSCINKSAFGVLNGAVGLDDFIFDNISKFEVKGQTVLVRKEIDTYIDLYRDVYKVIGATSDVANIDWKSVDALYNRATKGGFYKTIVLNAAGELITNYQTLLDIMPSLNEFEFVFEDLKNGLEGQDYTTYFGEDIDNLYSIVSGLGNEGFLKEVTQDKVNAVDALVLLTTEYNELLTNSVSKLFKVHIIRNAFSSTLDYALSKVSGEGGDIFKDVNTDVTDEDWAELESQVTGVITNLGEINDIISEKVSIGEIFSDLKKVLLIDQEKIDEALEKIGGMIDSVDNMVIMQDKSGEKILPQLLNKFGIGNLLNVEKVDDDQTEVKTYTDLMNFLATPVKNLLSLDLYDAVSGGLDMNKMLKTFATKLVADKEASGDGSYSKFMEETILPLYRIEFLRTRVFDKVTDLKNDMVDFSLLVEEKNKETGEVTKAYDFQTAYNNWKTDLPLLTQVITELESVKYDDTQTMLDYLLSGGGDNINEIIKNENIDADKILTPILNARCMEPLKEMLADKVVETMKKMSGDETITLDFSNKVFISEDSQTEEIVKIFKAFIEILKNTPDLENISLKTLDATLLGNLMNAIRDNAYRDELQTKSAPGVTRGMFDATMEKAEAEFGVDLKTLLNKDSYAEIDFNKIFELAQLANDTSNAFAQKFKDVVFDTEKKHEAQDYQELINSVTQDEETQKTVEQMLDIAEEYNIQVELESDVKSQVESYLNSQQGIDENLKTKLKNLLGLGEGA